MKFGILLGNEKLSEMIKYARSAEENGFDFVWLADHSPAYLWRDVFVALGAIASNTDSINLGTAVTNPYTRQTGLLGVAIASVAELCRNRKVVLGLGPGGASPLTPLGIKRWNKPLRAMRESVQILRILFSGETVDFEGQLFRLKNTKLFEPFQIPIYLAVRGLKMARLAGEISDGFLLNPPFATMPSIIEKIEKSNKKIDFVMLSPLHISDNLEPLRRRVAILMPTTPIFALEKIGLKEQAKRVLELMPNLEEAGKVVSDDLVRNFAIVGNTDQCIKQIQKLKEEGINQFVMQNTSQDLIKKVADEIMPSF